jgi:hypothetical protein
VSRVRSSAAIVVAVELDDETLVRPEGVRAVGPERRVGSWPGDAMRVEEPEKAALPVALRDRLADPPLLPEGSVHRLRPVASRVARDLDIEADRACEPLDLGLVERVLELLLRYDGGEVDERARGVRDRDAAPRRHLIGAEDRPMRLDSGPATLAGAVTSTAARELSRMLQSAAAERWLSTAPGPTASTAAIQTFRRVSRRWPTA